MRRLMSIMLALLVAVPAFAEKPAKSDVKVLYWNIQNGMWSDQAAGYDNFVAFVKELNPDICVWCEAESRYRTDTADKMEGCEEQYLPWNWDMLARRYGHEYVVICGKRDTFPQVITSRYPLTVLKRITGNGDDIIVVHGAGWATVDLGSRQLNIVTLHTWPQKYAYLAEDTAASAAAQGGDTFRAEEVKYICEQTIGTVKDADRQMWMMLGDFNAISSVDNYHYGLEPSDKAFAVHDYVMGNTPYRDVIAERYPGDFQKSTLSGRRIDMVYLTEPLLKRVRDAKIIREGFAESSRDPRGLHGFCNPSDHYPVMVEFRF